MQALKRNKNESGHGEVSKLAQVSLEYNISRKLFHETLRALL